MLVYVWVRFEQVSPLHLRKREGISEVWHLLQSYLLSIRPFLHPRFAQSHNTAVAESSKASDVAGGSESKTLTTSSDQDDVFSWGRDIDVDYKNLFWVTFRDQVSTIRNMLHC